MSFLLVQAGSTQRSGSEGLIQKCVCLLFLVTKLGNLFLVVASEQGSLKLVVRKLGFLKHTCFCQVVMIVLESHLFLLILSHGLPVGVRMEMGSGFKDDRMCQATWQQNWGQEGSESPR